jgi:acetyl esterase/lipase
VVVCPGGGYHQLATLHEGHDVALLCNEAGITAFVLEYRHNGDGYKHPIPLTDLRRALRKVRSIAKEWNLDQNRIGVMGFSAGGHLAASASIFFDDGTANHTDPIERYSSRPDFCVLGYPVILMDHPNTHRGSQENLLGSNPDPSLLTLLSLEKSVHSSMPPTFLFHTDEDVDVPSENSILFYLALRQSGVPSELHVYARGEHGLGLAPGVPGINLWPQQMLLWLQNLGLPHQRQ